MSFLLHPIIFKNIRDYVYMEVNLLPFYSFVCILRSAQDVSFSSLTISGSKLLVACTRSVMSDAEKNCQNKSCKRTGYMQGALWNKLLTIYATAKTGWEVNPRSISVSLSVCPPLCLYFCLSVLSVYFFCVFLTLSFSKFRLKAKDSKGTRLRICAYSWSTHPVLQIQGRRSPQHRFPAKCEAREGKRC